MLNRLLSISLAALFAIVGAACIQAETINYNETFAYSSSSTLATVGSAGTAAFTGAASPYYSWYVSGAATGSSVTGSASGLTFTQGRSSSSVYTTASQLVSSSAAAFDVSTNALTVSAVLAGNGTDASGGWYSMGLKIGGLKIEIWPGLGRSLERVYPADSGTALVNADNLGFTPTTETAYTFTASISGATTSGYSLTYTIASSTKTFTNTISLTASQLGTFDRVGVYIEDTESTSATTSYVTVTSFSVTQVPEPSTAMLLLPTFGLLAYAWRKRKKI
jgi:hypothetical protein